MVNPLDALPLKVQAIEDKLDALSASVEARFDEVTFAFVEQRQYTESAFVEQRQYTDSAFERLRSEMTAGFRTEMTAGFRTMTGEFGRLERKLDQVIDRLTRPRSDP